MRSVSFPEATTRLGAPEGMEDDILELPVWHTPGHAAFISKWRLTWKERLHCLIFGHVWLHVLSAQHPPVVLETRYPFERAKSGRNLLFLLGVPMALVILMAVMALVIWRGF